jgi:hypothetical protein
VQFCKNKPASRGAARGGRGRRTVVTETDLTEHEDIHALKPRKFAAPKMKRIVVIRVLLPVILFIALVLQLFTTAGCANIIPPEGGPRDSLPPVLRRASPPDSSLNFSDRTIVLSFDEYVDADNYLQEMIVSPMPANMPTVNRKLNTVTVKLRDTLEPNTTYSINFGNTIKDVNEGNPLKNFTYTFATGNYMDSLDFSGNVVLAETGAVDTTLSILLHKTNVDSALIKEKPRYVTKLDSKGHFHFRNLPRQTFYVYALKDEGGTYRYLNPSQLFAFYDSAVAITDSTREITLYAYEGKDRRPPIAASTTTESGGRKPADKRLKFTTNLTGDRQDLLDKLIITFENKLKNFDSSKVHFASDTTFTPLSGYRWQLDSTRKILSLDYPWKENTLYHLIVEKDFATDTLNQQLLKKDTFSFRAKDKREYGKLTVRFRNLDLSNNPVLLLVQNNEVKKSIPLTSNRFTLELFPPGDYSLRILSDRNKNGVWDPGIFFGKRQQPERVRPVQRTINVKPNWDNEFDIDVNAVAPPEDNRREPSQNQRYPGRPSNRPGNRF